MSLSEMEARGELEPLASTPEELARLHGSIQRRLKDASVELTSNEARFEHAYHAILGAALVGLRALDYRVDIQAGKHVLVLNTLKYTAGLADSKIRYLQKLRNRRNIDLYEGGAPVSGVELEEAIIAAHHIVDIVITYVKQLRPEISC